MAKTYRVVIPYYHEFIVKANNKQDALTEAHSQEGKVICYDDEAEIEECNEKDN